MAETPESVVPTLPIPIFHLASKTDRFMLYDIDTVTWLRREHHILGVLSGTLPQIPQQNVFLGLPLELMVEEARLLVDKGIAYVVRDSHRHQTLKQTSAVQDREAYRALTKARASEAFQASEARKEAAKANAAQRTSATLKQEHQTESDIGVTSRTSNVPSESLFGAEDCQPTTAKDLKLSQDDIGKSWASTPTSSFPLLPRSDPSANKDRPIVKESSFALFKYLHDRDYFLSPGLRFGCQFTAYPGDPLRYHSHFLAVSADWEEEINLLDLLCGGRLGTGVKKGFLLGGLQHQSDGTAEPRAFCIEWGGM